MGKVGKIIRGVAIIAGATLIGVATGNWTLAFMLASSGIGILTRPRVPNLASLDSRQATILSNRVGNLQALPLVYGTAKLAGILADVRVDGNSTVRSRLVIASAWCHGSRDGTGIYSIDSMWFDDRKAVDGVDIQDPFNKAVDGEKTTVRYLAFQHHLGNITDAVDARLNQLFPTAWPTTSKGQFIAYSRIELWYSADIYPSGIPDIQVVIRGNKVFDPRDGTWKYSDNPVLCIRDYMISAIYGCGVPEENIEDQSFIDMANYCDELVTDPTGGLMTRYVFDGWVDTSKSVQDNLADMCTSCRALVVNEGDVWRIIIRRQRTARTDFTISAKNTVEGSWQFVLGGNDSAPNIARATFVNPALNYATDNVGWPEPGADNPYLTEDNGFENILSIDLPYTQSRGRAQQILMTLLKEGRRGIGCTVTLKEEALDLRVGELIPVTQDTPGWIDKLFDVIALQISADGSVTAILAEYDPDVYDVEEQFIPAEGPGHTLPNPFTAVPPTSLVLTSQDQAQIQNDGGYVPRIRATWTKANDPFVDFYEVQARRLLSSDVVDVAAPFGASNFTHSGLSAFNAALVWNDVLTVDNAFHTDTAVAGAYLKLDCGTGIKKEYVEARIWLLSAPTTPCQWAVDYSDDGSTWGTAVSAGFVPSTIGLTKVQWASVGAHEFWRIRLLNTPGGGPWAAELEFKEAAWDNFGRVFGSDAPLVYIYPVTVEYWYVRIRTVNKLGVKSAWLQALHLVSVPDPRPQILSITMTTAHSDTHSDVPHQDIAHGDSAHSDAHSDAAHTDHTDHGDAHSDDSGHFDAAHVDTHSDVPHDIDHVDEHSDSPHGDHSDGHSDTHTDTDHNDTAHDDAHSDGPFDTPHTDAHSDNPHTDHTDSGFSHTDVSHVDSHSDTGHSDNAHSDAHTDAHSDGQHGIGIAIQADSDTASVKAVARKVSSNLITNGGGETGTVGSSAPSWTLSVGNALKIANDFSHGGAKSLKIINGQSYSAQTLTIVAGKRYRFEGWIKQSAFAADNAGLIASSTGTLTLIETNAPYITHPSAGQINFGLPPDGAAHDWTYIFIRLSSTATDLNVYCILGLLGTTLTGSGWFDDLGVFADEPTVADVRTQPSVDGRNVSIELIDAATGAQILLSPGDQVRIGALAYSSKNAGGVEGPLALASAGLFNVAPVGTDLWVPA